VIPAVDAHCHLSDERLFSGRKTYIENCAGFGVNWFVLGGVKPAEWSRQLELKKEFPNKIFCSFGLHPYTISAESPAALESAFQQLKTLTSQTSLMGEMGLDFRSHIVKDREEMQREFFVRQLEWAKQSLKPIVLHIVRAHEEALKILKTNSPQGMVHAFSSSFEVAKRYLSLGLYLSLGARVLEAEHQELLKNIPLDQMLLESDAPDQPPRGKKEHDSTTVLLLAKRVAENKGLTVERVLEKTRENAEQLLGERFLS
jgi:TatD DNase family protein